MLYFIYFIFAKFFSSIGHLMILSCFFRKHLKISCYFVACYRSESKHVLLHHEHTFLMNIISINRNGGCSLSTRVLLYHIPDCKSRKTFLFRSRDVNVTRSLSLSSHEPKNKCFINNGYSVSCLVGF